MIHAKKISETQLDEWLNVHTQRENSWWSVQSVRNFLLLCVCERKEKRFLSIMSMCQEAFRNFLKSAICSLNV